MLPWRLLLILGTAVGAGAGAWAALRPGAGRAEHAAPAEPPPPSDADVTLQEAADHLKAADRAAGHERAMEVDLARRRLADLAVSAPGDPRVAFWTGMAAILAGDEHAARAAHARLRSLRGVTARDPAWRFLGALVVLQFEPDAPDPALRTLRALQAEAPGFMPEPVSRALWRALLQAAVVRPETRDSDLVVRLVREAVEVAKDDPVRTLEARRMLAYAYARAHRFVEAQEQWEWLVARSEGQAADLVAGLASSYAVQNQWEKAVETFTRALALKAKGQAMRLDDPALDEILLRRGNCYRMLERADLAKQDLEAYLAGHPDDHRAYYWLGALHLDPLDEPDRAREYLEKAAAMAPWCDNYARLLLEVYEFRRPDPAKAAALRRAIEEGKEAHRAERERLAKQHREGRFICE